MNLKNLIDLSLFVLTRCISCDIDFPTSETFPICVICQNALLPGLNLHTFSSDWIDSQYSLYQLTDAAYPVLRRWKTRRGPLFDRQVLKRVDLVKLFNYLDDQKTQAIVPMPQDYRRSWKMGGSPAMVLAQFVSLTSQRPLLGNILTRTHDRKGKRQAELLGWDRIQTRLHFKVKKNSLGLGSILLVDDFSTTGHTLTEAARAIKEAGYGKIHTLCLGARSSLIPIQRNALEHSVRARP
jgi:predicted amidophosphoribosyltransferase